MDIDWGSFCFILFVHSFFVSILELFICSCLFFCPIFTSDSSKRPGWMHQAYGAEMDVFYSEHICNTHNLNQIHLSKFVINMLIIPVIIRPDLAPIPLFICFNSHVRINKTNMLRIHISLFINAKLHKNFNLLPFSNNILHKQLYTFCNLFPSCTSNGCCYFHTKQSGVKLNYIYI